MEAQLPSKLPFSKKPLRARVIISYILDYVILIALVLGFFILDRIEPYHQPFALENYTLHYPYAVHERIPIPQALAISGGFPIVVIFGYTILLDGLFSHHSPTNPSTGRRKLTGPYRWKDRLWELNCGILGLLLAQASAFVITSALKNACGKPRPDVIDRCQIRSDVELARFELANYTMCTQEDAAILKDGFKSFPSGHSSSSFAGLFYLTLYLSGKLHVWDSRGEVWKTFIVLVPTVAAALVAISRIMDARHHPFDVIFGSLLGTLCAFGAYRQYFPPLSESWRKGRAYPIRTWGTVSQPPPDSDRVRLVAQEDSMRPDEEEYRRMPGSTMPSGQTHHQQHGHSGLVQRGRSHSPASADNPFEPVQPNPFLARVGTEVPSNYSSSSSDSNRATPVGLHRGDGNDAYEMQSNYGGAQKANTKRSLTGQTTGSAENVNSPFTPYSAYRPPARDASPESPADLAAPHARVPTS